MLSLCVQPPVATLQAMSGVPGSQPPAVPTLPAQAEMDTAARAAELQARIQSKMATVALGAATSATVQSGYLRLVSSLPIFVCYRAAIHDQLQT